MAIATPLNFGPMSAVRTSFAAKQDGGVQARLSCPALRSPFLSGEVISILQQLRVSHYYTRSLERRPSMRSTMSLEPNWEEIAKKLKKVQSVTSVHIDQHSDPDATMLELSFGNHPSSRIEALLDTMEAFKNLRLNIVRAQVTTEDDSAGKNRFYVTCSESGNKVENPETMRLTIIYNLLKCNPTVGKTFGLTPAIASNVKFDAKIPTTASIQELNPRVSVLSIKTEDRPSLLFDIIKFITRYSVVIKSAVINTDGMVAKDQFYVSYEGAAPNEFMETILTKLLSLHLKKLDPNEDEFDGFFD